VDGLQTLSEAELMQTDGGITYETMGSVIGGGLGGLAMTGAGPVGLAAGVILGGLVGGYVGGWMDAGACFGGGGGGAMLCMLK